MFYFTSKLDPALVARKMEINDNVIPASNSVMANVLYDLGTLLDKDNYKQKAIIIANNVRPDMQKYASAVYANYGNLILKEINPYYEVAVVGKDAHTKAMELNQTYIPNKLLLGTSQSSEMELYNNCRSWECRFCNKYRWDSKYCRASLYFNER